LSGSSRRRGNERSRWAAVTLSLMKPWCGEMQMRLLILPPLRGLLHVRCGFPGLKPRVTIWWSLRDFCYTTRMWCTANAPINSAAPRGLSPGGFEFSGVKTPGYFLGVPAGLLSRQPADEMGAPAATPTPTIAPQDNH
jgi:hypothetical protein